MQSLIQEMQDYYRSLPGNWATVPEAPPWDSITDEIDARLDAEEKRHPDLPAVLLKAYLHELIAEKFEPVIFRHSPFYFEMGIKPATNWGTPGARMPGSLLYHRRRNRFQTLRPEAWRELELRAQIRLDTQPGPVDLDHHCFNYTRVLAIGLNGLRQEAESELPHCRTPEETAFIRAAIISIDAVIRIAKKFAAKARTMLEHETDPEVQKRLKMIAATASEVPRRPPQTFYEGLAALWFLREVSGSIEAVGMSVIGHPDRTLIELYRRDLAAGRLNRAEAEDLVARWLLPTDQKYGLDRNGWPETSTTLMLGGCDRTGHPVFNEITVMMIEQHHRLNLINPKLNCRYHHDSPPEYLQLIARGVAAGHNVFALLNDEALIPANVKAGKTIEDCRFYAAGGCQETIVEGVEHSAGAYYYFNLPLVLNLLLNPTPKQLAVRDIYRERNEDLSDLQDFPAFYSRFLDWTRFYLRHGVIMRTRCAAVWPNVHPCPFFSAALYDCLSRHRDYTAGGGRYNPSGVSLCGLGTLVDSLFAIRRLCFDEHRISLPELARILGNNWTEQEPLRQYVIALPKFGHGIAEVDALTSQLTGDLAASLDGLENERGGRPQLSFFVYYEYVNSARKATATPDGRRDGEVFSQGVSPGRLQPTEELTAAIHSLRHIDFSNYPGNAVLDLQLPLGQIDAEAIAAVIRTAGQAGIPTLQFNCVNVDQLREAQRHPERYAGLTVRISGLSARFVALSREIQDEIIARNLFR